MFRVIMEIGEGVPTRVFGGDYDTREAAEKAVVNIEKTTHYKAKVHPLTPLNLTPNLNLNPLPEPGKIGD